MQNSAFQLGKELNDKKVYFRLHQPFWIKYDLSSVNLEFNTWTTIKYLNDNCDDFGQDINLLPNDTGGIYLFSIKCDIIKGLTDFPVYIGRAQQTKGQNLRKRCREYFTKFAREDERPKITRMINIWGDSLFLSFKPLDDNDELIDYEQKLINSLLLPFNDIIPDKETSQAIKAFQ